MQTDLQLCIRDAGAALEGPSEKPRNPLSVRYPPWVPLSTPQGAELVPRALYTVSTSYVPSKTPSGPEAGSTAILRLPASGSSQGLTAKRPEQPLQISQLTLLGAGDGAEDLARSCPA